MEPKTSTQAPPATKFTFPTLITPPTPNSTSTKASKGEIKPSSGLENILISRFFRGDPQQAKKDLKELTIRCKKENVLLAVHALGSLLISNKESPRPQIISEYESKKREVEDAKNSFLTELGITPEGTFPLSEEQCTALFDIQKRYFQETVSSDAWQKLYPSILLNLDHFNSQSNKNLLLECFPNPEFEEYFNELQKLEEKSKIDLPKSSKKSTEAAKAEEIPNQEIINFRRLRFSCKILESYKQALATLWEKVRGLNSEKSFFSPGTSEKGFILKIINFLNLHTSYVVTQANKTILMKSEDEKKKAVAIVYQYFISRILEQIENSHLAKCNSLIEIFKEGLIRNIRDYHLEPTSDIHKRLFVEKTAIDRDLARALLTPSVSIFLCSDENSKMEVTLDGSISADDFDKLSTSQKQHGRFKVMMSCFSQFFFQNKSVLNDLITLFNIKEEDFEKFHDAFFNKLMKLDEKEKTKIKDVFQKNYPRIEFDKAFAYLIFTQNILAQVLLHKISKHLAQERKLKVGMDKSITFAITETYPKANSISIIFYKKSVVINYTRNSWLIFKDVLFQTSYSIRYTPSKNKIEEPLDVQASIYCPKEKLKEENYITPDEKKDLQELKASLQELPLFAKGLFSTDMKIEYRHYRDEKTKGS